MRQFLLTQKALSRVYRKAPQLVGALAVNFYKQSFKRKGYVDKGYKAWKPTKRDVKGKWGNDHKRKSRTILVKSGRLRRSIRIVKKTKHSVLVGTDVPYARKHNEGFEGTINQRVRAQNVRAHKRKGRDVKKHSRKAHSRTVRQKIPQRQFMGQSAFLNKRIARTFEMEIHAELKKI